MANLKFIGMQAGSAAPHIEVLPIETDKDLDAGSLIALGSNRKLTTQIGIDNPEIIGTVAVDYKCKKDDFNPENGSGKIRVNLSQGSIYSMPLPKLTALSDTSTGVLTVSEGTYVELGDKLVNSQILFLSKGENSKGTLNEGDILTIESVSYSSGKVVLTLSESVVIGKGDKFRFVPSFGFDMLCPSGADLIFGSVVSIAKVIGNDKEMKNAYIVLKKAFLA